MRRLKAVFECHRINIVHTIKLQSFMLSSAASLFFNLMHFKVNVLLFHLRIVRQQLFIGWHDNIFFCSRDHALLDLPSLFDALHSLIALVVALTHLLHALVCV